MFIAASCPDLGSDSRRVDNTSANTRRIKEVISTGFALEAPSLEMAFS